MRLCSQMHMRVHTVSRCTHTHVNTCVHTYVHINTHVRTHGQTPKHLLSHQLICVYVDFLFSLRVVLSLIIAKYPENRDLFDFRAHMPGIWKVYNTVLRGIDE